MEFNPSRGLVLALTAKIQRKTIEFKKMAPAKPQEFFLVKTPKEDNFILTISID